MEKHLSNPLTSGWKSTAAEFGILQTRHYSNGIQCNCGVLKQLSIYFAVAKFTTTLKQVFVITIDDIDTKALKLKTCIVVTKLKGRINSVDYVYHENVPAAITAALSMGYRGDLKLHIDDNNHIININDIVGASLHQFDVLWSWDWFWL